MGRDMGALVRGIVKDMQWNRSVEKIAKKKVKRSACQG